MKYRLTPWDSKVFGIKTAEIFTDDKYSDKDNFYSDLLSLEKEMVDCGVEFVYTRIDGNNLYLRKILQDNGYYFAESSLNILIPNIQRYIYKKLPKITFTFADISEIEQIKAIARDSFDFGRFHEDPNISIEKSKQRYYNWIDDLVIQKADINVARVNEKIVGFCIQKNNVENSYSELILGGCSRGFEVYALSLWNEIFEYNKNIGMRRVKTVVSSSNIGILNLYSYFNFRVEKSLFGFHKFLNNSIIL